LENTKATPQRKIDTQINGRMNRSKEIPEDFIATNSKLSPRLPKVMMEEIKIAIGIASVNKDALAYHIKVMIVTKSNPLPTRSSMYFHSVCIINTKNAIKKVAMKGPMKDFSISLSSFFIIQQLSAGYILHTSAYTKITLSSKELTFIIRRKRNQYNGKTGEKGKIGLALLYVNQLAS